jgi:hypothetical protein
MSWLARLKTEIAPDHQATKPTKPQQRDQGAGSVGFVGFPPAPFQKIEANETAANDKHTEAAADPDRCCWPRSEAMNGQEIDTFTARLSRFTDKGLTLTDAEQQADRLVIRDREGDDRRLCMECAHLHGAGPWRCGNWQRAEIGSTAVPDELVRLLQRCDGFNQRS